MNITVVGLGYVGVANLILYSSNHDVIALDSNEDKVYKLNNNIFAEYNEEVSNYLISTSKKWRATTDFVDAYTNSHYILICLPTDYDEISGNLDTSIIDREMDKINHLNCRAVIIIKSTVPVGYCKKLNTRFSNSIISCPEFLREGMIFSDSLYPSRIVVGGEKKESKKWAKLVGECIKNKSDVPIIITGYNESEAIKLFSNAYLAMRVAYFNELDMYAESNNLDSREIITGVCADHRIGNYYNNPSFGYGGYCLPKDTKELVNEFVSIPHSVINSIEISNSERIAYIARHLLHMNVYVIGIYRLTMKFQSDNYRNSAIIEIINILKENNKEIIIFEPLLKNKEYEGIKVYSSFQEFCSKADVIIANRLSKELDGVMNKVYTRDLFGYN